MNTIIIYSPRESDGMYITVHDDPAVIGLFGTNALPTPFLAPMPFSAVELRVRDLNPEAEVRCGGRWDPALEQIPDEGTCLVCGCTDMRACVVEGAPCSWVGPALCSACAPPAPVAVLGEPEDFPW